MNNDNIIDNNRYLNLFNTYNNNELSKSTQILNDHLFLEKLQDRMKKMQYGNDLRKQIEEDEQRKLLEKKKKEEEDLKDELRIKKELEEIEKRRIEEDKKIKEVISKKNKENDNLLYNGNLKGKRNKKLKKETPLSKSYTTNQLLIQKQESLENFNNQMLNAIYQMSNDFRWNYTKISNELETIKNDNFHANMYNVDLGKSIKDLKDALKLKKYYETFEKYYYYKRHDEDNSKYNNEKKILNKYNNQTESYYDKLNDNAFENENENENENDNNNNFDLILPPIILDHNISYSVPKIIPFNDYDNYY